MADFKLGWIALVVAIGCAGPSAAQPAGDGKKPAPPAAAKPQAGDRAPNPATAPLASIGVIDMQAVLRQSTAAQALQKQFKIEQDDFQAATEKLQKELKAAEEELERQRAALTPDAFAEKRRKFQERLNQVNSDFRNRRRQIEEVFNTAMAELQRTLNAVVEEIAQRNSVNMVLRKEAVLANLTALDLTEQTLQEFNRRMPALNVVFPQRP